MTSGRRRLWNNLRKHLLTQLARPEQPKVVLDVTAGVDVVRKAVERELGQAQLLLHTLLLGHIVHHAGESLELVPLVVDGEGEALGGEGCAVEAAEACAGSWSSALKSWAQGVSVGRAKPSPRICAPAALARRRHPSLPITQKGLCEPSRRRSRSDTRPSGGPEGGWCAMSVCSVRVWWLARRAPT